MELTELVNTEANSLGAFVVGHSIGEDSLYQYYVDTEGMLNMQTLTELTRMVSKKIDETELGDEPFTIEISSPGADKPLNDIRQFPKHVGRVFEIETNNSEPFEAKLMQVNEGILVFEKRSQIKEKNKKIELVETLELSFEQIKSATIKIAFK